MKHTCLTCSFKDEIKHGKNETEMRILCLFYNQWYDDSYHCKHWREYQYHLTKDEKLKMARAIRQSTQNRYSETIKNEAEFFVMVTELIITTLLLWFFIMSVNRILFL